MSMSNCILRYSYTQLDSLFNFRNINKFCHRICIYGSHRTKLLVFPSQNLLYSYNALSSTANLNYNDNFAAPSYTLCEMILVLLRAQQSRLLRAPVVGRYAEMEFNNSKPSYSLHMHRVKSSA